MLPPTTAALVAVAPAVALTDLAAPVFVLAGTTQAFAIRHAFTALNFSMGDIPMGIMAHWWYSFPIDHGDLPRMADWYQRLLQRPAFQKSVVQPLDHAD